MLVLSRREAEKVLFPTLGITVEVTRVQGKTVRLGIDAPDEIRIVRGELNQIEPKTLGAKKSPTMGDQAHVQRCLDAANLAIHLAMNQLRQQLNDQAGMALENALECLEELELAVVQSQTEQTWEPATTSVREAITKYRVSAKPAAPTAAIVTDDGSLRRQLNGLLSENGFRVVEFIEEASLLKYLQTYEQPAVVLAIESASEKVASIGEAVQDVDPDFQLRISGVPGLRRNRISFSINNPSVNSVSQSESPLVRLTGWFDDSEIAAEFESILKSA